MKKAFLCDLSRGIPESRFWAAFVQCIVCKDVVFRDTVSITHKCRDDKGSGGRYHPYSRSLKRTVSVKLETAHGDTPISFRLRSMRPSSPVPTELNDHDADNEAASEESEVEDGDSESSPPRLSSDFEFPSIAEIIAGPPLLRD